MKRTLLASALLFALSAPAFSDTIYTVQTVAPPGDANHQATATFDFSDANTLTLTLENTGNVLHLDSILTDFHFDLSATPTGSSLGTMTAPGGSETCSTTNGPPPHVTTCTHDSTTDVSGDWSFTPSGVHVDMLAGGKLHPFGIANDTFAVNAKAQNNPGGLSNGQHNPVLLGPVDFAITFTGLTEIPAISNVVFSFGTEGLMIPGRCTSANNCQPPEQETPEPSILSLLGVALLGMGLGRRRST